MKILIIGSGGREHALALQLEAEGGDVFALPGNAGFDEHRRLAGDALNLAEVVDIAKREAFELVVVGPEAPLAAGLSDALEHAGILVYGPSKVAAELEASKSFAKECMAAAEIPTARYEAFSNYDDLIAYLGTLDDPCVLKADGLAAGKGVFVCHSPDQALAAAQTLLRDKAFGSAGERVLCEECLSGPEISLHVIAAGEEYIALPLTQDHKRLLAGDLGPNTGGMGTYAPTPFADDALRDRVVDGTVAPMLAQLKAIGRPFYGTLFVGLMLTDEGPKVLEYNVRFGDPETQTLMALVDDGLLAAMTAVAKKKPLPRLNVSSQAALTVILASGGYPGAYEKGEEIVGLEEVSASGVQVYHAGTARRGASIVTNGGRVLGITACAPDIDAAAERAYRAVKRVSFSGKQFRVDIGHQARTR